MIDALRNVSTRRSAFSELVIKHSEEIYWTARHIVGNHQDADDVVQNTFIKAWNKLDEFRGDSKFSTWLHRIAVNEALDLLRKEKKFMGKEVDVRELNGMFADDFFDGDETERMLRNAIESLPTAQRTVFCMKYFDNKTYKEISEILGTSEGGLKANFHHAVDKIRKYFSDKI